MSILPTNAIRGPAPRPAQGRRQAGFTVADQPRNRVESSALSAISTDPLLFLQEIDSPQERDARSRRHGADLLDLLAQLQQGLLDGTPQVNVLENLLALTGQPIVAATPGLQEVVAAITLRAHVEMARRTNIAPREQSS